MKEDGAAWLENVLGAAAGVGAGEDKPDMEGARCPKCGGTDFAKVSDLYSESVVRLEDATEPSSAVRDGGMTDLQIVREFAPPHRKSATGTTIAVAIPLGVGAYLVYRRFGDNPGQIAAVVAIVLTVIVLMTRLRSYSDRYYHDRQRWNRLFMCKKCGQRVAG